MIDAEVVEIEVGLGRGGHRREGVTRGGVRLRRARRRLDDGDGQRQERHRDDREGAHRTRNRASDIGVENGHEASLQFGASRHRHGGGCGPLHRLRSGDVEQVGGVVRWPRAQRQHLVVAGALAFDAQPLRGDPDERIEPVDGARHLRDRLDRAIPPLDVRQLVCQHRCPALVGPRVGIDRQQHDRPRPAPGHRHTGPRAAEQSNGAHEAQAVGQVVQEVSPAGVHDGRRGAGDPPGGRQSDREAE